MTPAGKRFNKLSITAIILFGISVSYTFAAAAPPLTPELAAKRENHRKQNEQQHITQDQRKAAAAALKAERLKVHQARQMIKRHKPAPVATDTK